jgi:DHA1 family multidrug resistance protein-like MFS transporter
MNDDAPPHWHRTLLAMVGVQFVISSAFSIIPPVIPLLLHSLGVDTPGATRIWAGVLIGVTPLAAALASPAWGRLAGRVDPRRILVVACVAAGLCTAAMSLVTHPWQLLALRLSMGLFGGHAVAGMALVSTATPVARLGRALGWMATAQLAGSLLGPLFGGAIADLLGSFRAPFLVTGAAALLVCAMIRLVPPRSPRTTEPSHRASGAMPKQLITQRELTALVVVVLLAQWAILSPQAIISLHVRELVGVRPDLATLAGLAFSVVGLSGLLAAPIVGRASDAVGTRTVLLFIVPAAALFTVPQAYAPGYSWFVAERFLAGLFLAGILPAVNAMIGRGLAESDRGRAYGFTASASFLGAGLGPASGGLIGATFGLSSVFLVAGGLLSVLALWVAARVPGRPHRA